MSRLSVDILPDFPSEIQSTLFPAFLLLPSGHARGFSPCSEPNRRG